MSYRSLYQSMYQHTTQIRVRYAETDQMGYLYYGNYAMYYEVGRAEAIRALGLSYQEMEDTYGVMMPVVSLNMRFVRPALYDELLTVQTVLRRLPDRFINFDMEIRNEAGKLVNGGKVRLCFVEKESRKSIVAPDCLLEKLAPYFDEA